MLSSEGCNGEEPEGISTYWLKQHPPFLRKMEKFCRDRISADQGVLVAQDLLQCSSPRMRRALKEMVLGFFSSGGSIKFFYFDGHGGEGTGRLCLGNSDARISPKEVFDTIFEYEGDHMTQVLIIVLDICCAGEWVKAFTRHPLSASTSIEVKMRLAAKADETAGGMNFTEGFLERRGNQKDFVGTADEDWLNKGDVAVDWSTGRLQIGIFFRRFECRGEEKGKLEYYSEEKAGQRSMKISVRAPDGDNYSLNFEPYDSVELLKDIVSGGGLSQVTNFHQRFHLVLEGYEIDLSEPRFDDHTLWAVGVRHGSILRVRPLCCP